MPWWATLATVAVAWRVAIFLPTLSASKHSAIAQQLHSRPDFIKAKAEFEEAAWRTKDRVAMMRARNRMNIMKKESGASMLIPFFGFLTIPFSYGMFRLFRAMAAIPVPSLETGGLAWFTDLTVHDPYYILPAASIAITVLMFQQTQAANVARNEMTENIQKGMKYVLPPAMFLCTAWLPAGIQWFFLVFSAGAVAQTSVTLQPGVRRWAGLPPLPSKGQAPFPSTGSGSIVVQNPRGSVPKNTKNTGVSSIFAPNKQKEEWVKAQEYEERRATEEKEKAFRRMEDIRRKRAEKRR